MSNPVVPKPPILCQTFTQTLSDDIDSIQCQNLCFDYGEYITAANTCACFSMADDLDGPCSLGSDSVS